MKKSKFFIAFFVLIVCSSSYAKDINITGTYKFKPCNILIKISKKDSGNKTKYHYTITENNQTKSKGYMPDIISNSEGEFYVQFKNFQAAYENLFSNKLGRFYRKTMPLLQLLQIELSPNIKGKEINIYEDDKLSKELKSDEKTNKRYQIYIDEVNSADMERSILQE